MSGILYGLIINNFTTSQNGVRSIDCIMQTKALQDKSMTFTSCGLFIGFLKSDVGLVLGHFKGISFTVRGIKNVYLFHLLLHS